ncbi:purine-cytosine permease family protein [Brevibacillus nitrificans]|uniref:purine-cytosine permease family protein n=1 Tax=Brevibacillus nitrificans TaxID=651560 RepID=UPI00260CFD13|nr:hypothetical protein [Brevibacillus nitrificans]
MSGNDATKLKNLPESYFYDTRDRERKADSTHDKDDYGLRRVPADGRFSAWSSAWSWMGLSTALAYPLTGALLTLSFGAASVLIGFAISVAMVGLGVAFTANKSANEGIGKDLMGRGSYGYYGSLVTIVVVGLYLTLLFSMETSVIARSLHEIIPMVPFWLLVLIIIAIFIPLGIYGMVWISKIQTFTLVLYVVGLALVFIGLYAGWSDLSNAAFATEWWTLNPSQIPTSWMSIMAATGAWMGAFGFMNIFAVTDVTRMTRRSERKKGSVLQVIINSVINSFVIGAMGIFFLAASNGTNPDPGITFVRVLGPIGLLLVFLTQVRGNVMNMYLGTLAFDNVIAQISKKSFMRSWLLIPYVILGFFMVVSPFLEYFPTIATFAGVFFAAWVGSTFGELMLVRPLYQIPRWSEFRRAYLPGINWVGFLSLIIPMVPGMMATLGVWGDAWRALSVFFTLALALVMPVILAILLGKQRTWAQYFIRIPDVPEGASDTLTCFVSGETEHVSDFVKCPFYGDQWISSTTCSSESRCKEMCHSEGNLQRVPKQPAI